MKSMFSSRLVVLGLVVALLALPMSLAYAGQGTCPTTGKSCASAEKGAACPVAGKAACADKNAACAKCPMAKGGEKAACAHCPMAKDGKKAACAKCPMASADKKAACAKCPMASADKKAACDKCPMASATSDKPHKRNIFARFFHGLKTGFKNENATSNTCPAHCKTAKASM